MERKELMPQKSAERERLEGQTLKSLDNSINMLVESNQIAAHTANKLDEQNERLNKIQKNSTKVNQTLDKSQGILSEMKSFMGSLFGVKLSAAKKEKKEREAMASTQKEKETNSKTVQIGKNGRASPPPDVFKDLQLDAQPTPSSPSKIDTMNKDFDNKVNSQLDQVDNLLAELKGRAVSMNKAISQQKPVINNIQTNVLTAQEKIETQRVQMKLMK